MLAHEHVCVHMCLPAERERVSATNVASTMITMLVNNPLVEQLDLSCMRVMSCGGSPQSPAVLTRAIAVSGPALPHLLCSALVCRGL
jgi:hypothetical protein